MPKPHEILAHRLASGVTNFAQIEVAPESMTPTEKRQTELAQEAIRKYMERRRQSGQNPPPIDFQAELDALDNQIAREVKLAFEKAASDKIAFDGKLVAPGKAVRVYDSTPDDIRDSLEEDHVIITVTPSGEHISLDEDDDPPTIDQQLDLSDLYL
jgi:hypothetical protein